MKKLSTKTYNELMEFAKDCRFDGMFGDGMEDDIIMYGCNIKGLIEMTEEELVGECERYCDDSDELIMKAKAELAVVNVLLK